MIKVKPLTESEMKDYFSDTTLEIDKSLPKDILNGFREKIKKNVGISKIGNIFYKLKEQGLGLTLEILKDPIYTPVTPIKSAYQCIIDFGYDKKWEEMVDKNKKIVLSRLIEICQGTKRGKIKFLDLDEKNTKKTLKNIRNLINVLVLNKHSSFNKTYEALRNDYEHNVKSIPEKNKKDAETLIERLEN